MFIESVYIFKQDTVQDKCILMAKFQLNMLV